MNKRTIASFVIFMHALLVLHIVMHTQSLPPAKPKKIAVRTLVMSTPQQTVETYSPTPAKQSVKRVKTRRAARKKSKKKPVKKTSSKKKRAPKPTRRTNIIDALEASNRYETTLILSLQKDLQMPKPGFVKVKITLKKDGSLRELSILSSDHSVNAEYIRKRLPRLLFPPFDKNGLKKDHETFTLTLQSQ